jgi:hypothetical protein
VPVRAPHVTADSHVSELLAEAVSRAPASPDLEAVVEDAGRQRLAAYYLYAALISGLIDDADLAPARWPQRLAEPMERLGLTRFAPRTDRALDAEITPAEQAVRRSAGRQFEFAQLVADLINQGAFGPVCGDADSVRVAEASGRRGVEIELVAGEAVVGTCKAEDHWELVAQQLASAPHGDDLLADPAGREKRVAKLSRRLKETGVSQAVSRTTDLAVGVYPLGTAVGIGTRLIRSRISTGRDEADAFHRLGIALRTLRAQADGEMSRHRSARTPG